MKTKTFYIWFDKNLNNNFWIINSDFEMVKGWDRIIEIEVPILTEKIEIKKDTINMKE